MTKVIAVIGAGRNSGKTTTVESLLKELCSRKFKVGTIKQVHKEDFSMDTPQKDTWRHAEAGASIVAAAAPHEVAVIKRLKNDDRFTETMHLLAGENLDLVIVEGRPPMDVPFILAARRQDSAKRVFTKSKGIICISSMNKKFNSSSFSVPVFNPLVDASKMVDLIQRSVSLHRKHGK